uniref:Uncharacterized protein n=1 Tax=Triticum urartu TaxID=4572 RepID=A0A8R7TH95_TRIUA
MCWAGCVWPRRAADWCSVERDEQASSCWMQRKQRSASVDLAKGAATKASSGGRGGADPAQGDCSRRRRWIWRTVELHGGGVRAGAAEMADQIMVKRGHLEATATVACSSSSASMGDETLLLVFSVLLDAADLV